MGNVPQELPADRAKRWELLDDLFAKWWQPPSNRTNQGVYTRRLEECEKRLRITLPAALREWYERYATLGKFWSAQDTWLTPEQLTIEQETLIFYDENQSVVRWGTRVCDLGVDDPPVVIDWCDETLNWPQESSSISEFAQQMFFFCIKWSEQNCGWVNGPLNSAVLQRLQEHYARLPLGNWRWPAAPTFFLGDAETVIELNGTGVGGWLWACARQVAAFRRLQGVLRGAGFEANASSDEWSAGWTTADDQSSI